MRQLNYLEIASFCQELAWLIHSGVSVGDGLHLLAEDEREAEWKKCIDTMAEQADEGLPLAEIIKNAACFPVYVQGIISVGETTGHLEESLHALTRYYQSRDLMISCTSTASIILPVPAAPQATLPFAGPANATPRSFKIRTFS